MLSLAFFWEALGAISFPLRNVFWAGEMAQPLKARLTTKNIREMLPEVRFVGGRRHQQRIAELFTVTNSRMSAV